MPAIASGEKAQITLAQMDERLQDLKTLAGDKQSRKEDCWARESSYWGLMGRLAESQNRKLDAMAYYENGLLKRLDAKEKPSLVSRTSWPITRARCGADGRH